MNSLALTHNAHMNIARDEYLLNTLAPGGRALFLYVNDRAVIIGRNQNPWLECNLSRMQGDNVLLARRVSGGGAVYHDMGNLNFSFICDSKLYDERVQTGVILSALDSLGIRAQLTGRNDIEINGLKFSGNAYCQRGHNRLRHGTLLVNSDLSVLSTYLSPPKLKLRAKGVASVRARVCNLSEYRPGLTVDEMADALRRAYALEYGECAPLEFKAEAEIFRLYEKHTSREWRLGEAPNFDYTFEERCSWGTAQLCLSVDGGRVRDVKMYTDALDISIPARIEAALAGAGFDVNDICARLESAGERELSEKMRARDWF